MANRINMTTKLCFILLTFPLLSLGVVRNGTVYLNNGVLTFKEGVMDEKKGLAFGTFDESYLKTGWDVLNIKAGYGLNSSNSKVTNQNLMNAAGFFEGYITSKKIIQHFKNMKDMFVTDQATINQAIKKFHLEQEGWLIKKILSDRAKTPFWRQISYTLAQFDGLYKGLKAAMGKKSLSRFELKAMNSYGDSELEVAIFKSARPNFKHMTDAQFWGQISALGTSRCSVLIKPTPGFENLFMGHSTWFVYKSMLRIYKHLDLNINDPSFVSKKMSFSSYPGFLSSLDDFYMMSSGLVMTETSNNIFDTSLYDCIHPQSLFAWQRVLAANRMARNGEEWGNIFKQQNSGTYNAQYMVVDLNKFTPKKEIRDGTLWVIEQIPGLVVSEDQTKILRNGYWASYNIPFYERIYNKSGYPETIARRGVQYSHALAPRAEIFRRDAGKVTDMKSMMNIMRYNDYKHDSYSMGNAMKSICGRGDLTPQHQPIGGTDTKVTDFHMASKLQSHAINGPTTSHKLPVFSWKSFPTTPHAGLAETFNFTWQTMKPTL